GSAFAEVKGLANGVAVGSFQPATTEDRHAFVYTDADGTTDLNDRLASGSGWVLSDAVVVNASGQIAGQGCLNGSPAAFRLTPGGAASDTTPPSISSVTANPSSITPATKAMVTVTVSVVATDNSGETPACAVTAIDGHGAPAADSSFSGLTASVRATGGTTYTLTVTLAVTASDDVDDAPACALTSISASGAAAGDYSITGAFSAQLRAVGGRVYRLNVDCADAAGNHAAGFTDVVVPPDAEAPVVTSLTASPGYLWPPNSKIVHVALAVQATDNLDATPQCTLTSVTGGGAGDASVTGALTASVRAETNGDGSVRLYTFHVTCVDDTCNSSTWTTGVAVSKAPALAAAAARFK